MTIAVPVRWTGTALDTRVPLQATLDAVGAAEHGSCFLCGSSNPMGIKLAFEAESEGSVVTRVCFSELYAGYPGVLHGGLVSALLDAAMTNALFSKGVVAVTAELTVRFLAPVSPSRHALVRGSVVNREHHRLYAVSAELEQDGKCRARATAKFLPRARE